MLADLAVIRDSIRSKPVARRPEYAVAMAEPVTAPRFADLDLPDWRWVLRRLEASFRASGSFADATEFVARLGRLGDESNHHPAIDVRFPGVVRVALSTHDEGRVTNRDVGMARAISAAAAEAGMRSEPRRGQVVEIAIDALDIPAVLPFWQAVLGYVPEPSSDGRLPMALIDPRGHGPGVWFQQMDEPRPQRNRIHNDIDVPHDEVDERLAAALEGGGTLVSEARARAFWVLADVEGNEACLCTWQDRD
jgi:4a-hydroxytetrahydrobiopterin dehydratase